jgi:antitoxin component YwqK of YwqJK toxin-antitoxin module
MLIWEKRGNKLKKLLLLIFSLLLSFNSYSKDSLDFTSDTFCTESPKAQVRNGLFYLPNQEEPYSGENICVYLSNGQYYSQGEIKKGLRHSLWDFWHENGMKKEKGDYKEGMKQGVWTSWYENGQKRNEGSYIGNWKEGIWTSWDDYGNKKEKGNFKYDMKQGIWTTWYQNGQKWKEGNYINNNEDGKHSYWDWKGQIKSEENYKDGQLVNETNYEYYDNGQVKEETNYKDGKKDGKWILWFESGQKWIENDYIDGKDDGMTIHWHENGQKSLERSYKNGKSIGKSYSWYSSGQIKSETNWKDDTKKGRQTWWDENGQITSEGEYGSTFNRVWWCSESCLSKWRENGSFADDKERYDECYSCKQASLQNLVQTINGEMTNLDGKYERIKEEERIRVYELQVERTAQQLAFENEQYNRLLTEEVQAEQGQEKLLAIEDQLNTLKSSYVSNIAARVRSFWRYQGAEDDWTAEVYVLQDRDGTVLAVDVRNSNVGDSQKAKVFKDSIRRAVYKASPLPSAPDEVVFDKELVIKFSVN